jgi:hypothetical protein
LSVFKSITTRSFSSKTTTADGSGISLKRKKNVFFYKRISLFNKPAICGDGDIT